MKQLYKIYFSILLGLTLASGTALSQTITVNDVPASLCANESFSLSFVSGFTPGIGNEYKVELSDASGTFSGNYIGSTFSVSRSGYIYVTIPASTAFGSGYRIRIVSTNPSVKGTASAAINISCLTRDYYWTGGSGNWFDLSHWEYTTDGFNFFPASEPPQPSDNANFDDQSFPSGGTLTFDNFVDVNDFYWEPGSGANNPSIQSNWNALQVRGELVIDAGVLINFADITFVSQKQGNEVNFGDNSQTETNYGRISFQGSGSWDLNSEMTTGTLQFYSGATFATNGYTININGQIWADGALNTFDTDVSEIYLQDLTSNGMDIQGSATWHFNSSYSGNIGRDLNLGHVILESGSYRFDGNCTIDELDIMPGAGIELLDWTTTTIATSLTATGTRDQMVTIGSYNEGTPATLTMSPGASVSVDFALIQDNIIVGTTAPYLANNSVDLGNNTGWTFNPISPLDYYWVGGEGSWSDNASHWGKLPGGGGFRQSPPGPLDNVHFSATSFPSGGTLTIDVNAQCNNMTWEAGSGASNPEIYGDYNNQLTVRGDFTLDAGVNRNIQNLYFEAASGTTQNLDFGDNTFDNSNIVMQGSGTWELQSDLGANQLTIESGTFNSNNNALNIESLYLSGTSISNWGSSVVTISSSMNNYDVSNVVFNAGTSTFKFIPLYSNWTTYLNGPFIFWNAEFSGKTGIQNDNYFNNRLTFQPGSDITLPSGNTQYIAGSGLDATGLRDQPIRIHSNNPGTMANISQSFGNVNTEYLVLQDNKAIGGATFNATNYTIEGASTNVQGWNLVSPVDPFDFYWVNGSGDWSDYANHWSQGPGDLVNMYSFAPGPIDNVIFTSESFGGPGEAVNIDNPVEVNNMTWQAGSGANSPTLSSSDYNNSLTIHGSLTMANGVERDLNEIIFDSPNTVTSLDFADNKGNANGTRLRFKGGGAWNLQSSLTAQEISIEDATFNTLNNEIQTYSLYLNSGQSVINLGASNVYLNYLADWSWGVATLNAGTSIIHIEDRWSDFNGPLSLNTVKVYDGGNVRVNSDIQVNNLTLDPGATLTIQNGVTVTTKAITAVGTSAKPIRIKSSTSGSKTYISQANGTVNAQYLLISDNDAISTGAASFTATNSIDVGNTGGLWLIVQPVPKSYYWTGGSGDWSDVSHWVTADGGSTNHTTPPGVVDNVFFTQSSFTAADQTVVIDQPSFCRNMTWSTTVAQSPTLFGPFDTPLKVYGSLSLANGVKRSVADLEFEAYTTGNQLNFADNISGSFDRIKFFGTGEWTLMSNLDAQEVNFEGGTFNTGNNTMNIARITFGSENPVTFNAGSSVITTTSMSYYGGFGISPFNKGTSTVHFVDSEQEQGYMQGPFVFNIVDINTDVRIYGSNGFSQLTINAGNKLTLGSDATQVIGQLSIVGTADNPVIIESSQQGRQGIFTVPSTGSVSATNMIIQDNKATGGAVFTATNSSQMSNVTGWTGLLEGQTITFPPLDDIGQLESATLQATASSGLNVSYQVLPITGSGSMQSNLYTPGSIGLVGIKATQPGNGTYGAAQSVTRYIHANLGDLPNELGQMKQASYVVGAPNGLSSGDYQFTDKSTTNLMQAIVGFDGQLIAGSMGRVMIWDQLPDDYNVPANAVVGQADFTSFSQSPSRTVLGMPNDIFTGGVAVTEGGQLIVADGRGVLIWNNIPSSNGTPADVIIGQTNFTSTTMAAAQDKFLSPLGVAVSSDGKLIVSDIAAHRVLIFNSIPTTNGAAADVVLGQPNFTSSSPGLSATSFAYPGFVTVTPDGKLLVADITNNRIMGYNTIPTTNNAPADFVLGQPDFISNSTGTDDKSFSFPMCAAVSRTGKLAVADWRNSRVLIFNTLPTNNSVGADLVLGQPDFNTNGFNEDNISLRIMEAPLAAVWDRSENLIISDSGLEGLSRIMVYGAKDLEPPVFNGLSPTPGAVNTTSQNVEPTIDIADRSGISQIIMHVQDVAKINPAGPPTYESIDLTPAAGGEFKAPFNALMGQSGPFANPNVTGIQFYFEIYDGAGNSVSTANNKITLPVYYDDGIPISNYGVGSTTENYRIFATPLVLDAPKVTDVFSTILSTSYDASKMRIFEFPAGGQNFVELTANSNIVPGKGYIALAKSGSPSSETSYGTSSFRTDLLNPNTGLNDLVGFEISLQSGWNLIGNPFNHNVLWSDIKFYSEDVNDDVGSLQDYNGKWDPITSIPAGGGAFVFANKSFNLIVPAFQNVGGKIEGSSDKTNPISDTNWQINLKTIDQAGNAITIGGIGMEEDAEFGKDRYDMMKAPTFGSLGAIEFRHPEYFYPSFRKDIRATADQEQWEFRFMTEHKEVSEQVIEWDNSYFGDNAPDIYLVDKTHLKVVNMKEETSYSFKHAGDTQFEIFYGVDAMNALRPGQLVSTTPYPNPFTDRVSINVGLPEHAMGAKVVVGIYDAMGKQITSLETYNEGDAYIEFDWNGSNNSGQIVPNGIYAYRVFIDGNLKEYIAGRIIKE